MLCADQLKTSTSTLPPSPSRLPSKPRAFERLKIGSFLWQFSYQKRKKFTSLISTSLPFNSSISSKHACLQLLATSAFAKKKKHIWNLTIPAQFSTLDLGKGQIRLPQEGLARQLSHSPDKENSQIPLDCRGARGEGGLKFRFDTVAWSCIEWLSINDTSLLFQSSWRRINFNFKINSER